MVPLRLAAVALLVLQSEEDAFWCLVALVDTIMPQDYYTKNLLASQVSLLPGAVVPGDGSLADGSLADDAFAFRPTNVS